ncbi:hypothetical protein [Singulisphaera sp. PoT]|uniref:hypothetical protein n=1 Tax=Singulisphaera sp. PoT TaxID=3411797 RepID=UPI003BF58F4B
MLWKRSQRQSLLGLGLAGMLGVLAVGCGGQQEETSDAEVVVAPDGSSANPAETPKEAAAPTPAATPAEPAPAPAATPTPEPAPAAPANPGASAAGEGWGTLKGKITFDGAEPAVKVLVEKGQAVKDPDFCAADGTITSERLVVDGATKGVKNVFVYIPKPTAVNPEAQSAALQAEVVFDQDKCVFKPHVLAVMAGAKIQMKNSDPRTHNINSKLRNNGTNPSLSAGASEVFPVLKPERSPGEVECNVHPWMKAYWMVTENPYFAVTDAKGNFEIKNVPAGTQKVVVWQESVTGGGFVTPATGESVNVKPNEETNFELKIDAGKIRPES